ncbi:MAG TPA: ComEC/Rec2 family competence protein [Acidobacteriaceae bacterium]|nr:ComEC/Rec2 family competence protein [Acidobacteriaceae bacterium]
MRQISGTSRPESESREARERRLWPRAPRVEPLQFRRAPLLAAAIAFALGEALTQIPPAAPRSTLLFIAGISALIALILVARRKAPRLAAAAVLALWIAAGLWSAQLEPSPAPQTALLAYADGLSRSVEGRIVRIRTLPPRTGPSNADSDPDQWDQTGIPSTAIDLDVTAVEQVTPDTSSMQPITGGIRVTLFADHAEHQQPALHCGDVVDMPLRLRPPERYRDPGVWQYADYLLDQKIALTASTSPEKLRTIASPRSFSSTAHCRIFAAQSWAAARLLAFVSSAPNRHLPAFLRLTPDDAGMLNAMLFGDRSRLTHTLRLGFERTGSFHLFVVSGMHVALLAGMLLWLARRFRFSNSITTVVTLILVSAYALITGFGVPVQRALLMTAVFLIARLLSRERNTLNALGAAALAVQVNTPHAIFEASFQMTFLSIVAIAGIAIPLGERSFLPYATAVRGLHQRWRDTTLPPRLTQFRAMTQLWTESLNEAFGWPIAALPARTIRIAIFIAELALIGLVAETVMVLPMALYFHRATVFALPANMFSIPLVAILVPLGLATFLAALISPYLATLPASALALPLHSITNIIHRISSQQSADLRVPGPTLGHALIALACFAFCCWAVRRSRIWAWTSIAVLPLAAAIVLWPSAPTVQPNRLEVTAIDVGQGDSLLVVAPTGQTMLIDAGGPTGAAANAENAAGLTSNTSFDIGDQVVSPYLWSRHLRRLDVVALTHAHSDHMGGMPAILRNFRPRELWVAVDPNSAPYRALLAEAATLGIHVRHLRAGDRIAWSSVDISVLAPTSTYTNIGPPINNDSLVMRMQFGKSSVLLEGDAEAPSERAMASAARSGLGAALGPDSLLKVGHHGSMTSTAPEFLSLAAPRDAVISVGRQNTFGHPRPEILERLAAQHTRIFRTDQSGLTTFLLSSDGGIVVAPPASNP